MASYLALVNPSRRKRHKRRSSRRSNPRHARRRVRHVARRHVRRNPIFGPRRHRRSVRHMIRRHRRRRRNPIMGRSMGGYFMTPVVGAVKGASGAILTDAAYTYIPLPDMLKSGPMSMVTRAAFAFLTGWLASFAVGRNMGAKLTEGALTVQLYNLVKPLISSVVPLSGSEIEGMGYYTPGPILGSDLSPLPPLNAGTGISAYLSGVGQDEGPFDVPPYEQQPDMAAYLSESGGY